MFVATVGDRAQRIEVTAARDGVFRVTIEDRVWDVDARFTARGLSLVIDGASHVAHVRDEGGLFLVDVSGEHHEIRVEEEVRYAIRTRVGSGNQLGSQVVKAPMPGRVTHVAIRAGDSVSAGQSLVVIEAMKMENELRARAAGTVREVRVETGQAVNAGDVLIVIDEGSA
jgi:pyruvate carboxylase subunit B